MIGDAPNPLDFQVPKSAREQPDGVPSPPFWSAAEWPPISEPDDPPERREALLSAALESSEAGLWDWPTRRPRPFLSPSYYRLLGYEVREMTPARKNWIDHVHPQDEVRLRSIAVSACRRKLDRISAEFRARGAGGEYRWFWLRGWTVAWDFDGAPARMVGTIIGIAQKKEWEQALRESWRRHETLLDSLPGMAYRCRRHNQVWRMEFVSPGCAELTGYMPSELTENLNNYRNLIHPDDKDWVWAEVEKAIRDRRKYEMVYRIKTVSGEDKWVWERGTGVFSETGKFIALEGFTTDITAYKKAEHDLKTENLRLKSLMEVQQRFGRLIGKSQAMRTVYDLILQSAASSANVIIYGESGTGKDLVAQAIHEMSDRSHWNFVSVNCGAIPENLMESEFFGHKKGAFTGAATDKAGYLDRADGGTLFLDEIGEIPPTLQVKLLRAIEGGGYTPVGGGELKRPDIRILCATNRDIKQMVWEGRIRTDFFYRIHIIPIQLPPLRERKEDIPLLMYHFMERFDPEHADLSTIPGHIRRAMEDYDWPGNVRELRNVMQRYVSLKTSDFLRTDPFGGLLSDSGPVDRCIVVSEETDLKTAVRMFEARHIQAALSAANGNRTHAARRLGVGLRTLQRKIREYRIE